MLPELSFVVCCQAFCEVGMVLSLAGILFRQKNWKDNVQEARSDSEDIQNWSEQSRFVLLRLHTRDLSL